MASLDMLLESLNEEDKKTRRVPDRTMSGDTLDSIKNHRRHSYKAPPAPVGAGGSTRTSMSRRGSRRPTQKGGNTSMSALSSFVESMNESQKSFQDVDTDPEEETVDSRQLTADKMPQLKASARRGKRPGSGRNSIAEEDAPKEEDEDEEEDSGEE